MIRLNSADALFARLMKIQAIYENDLTGEDVWNFIEKALDNQEVDYDQDGLMYALNEGQE